MPFQKRIGLDEEAYFTQHFMKPPRFRLQAGTKRDEHQLFGMRLPLRFAFKQAELLTEQGNLKVFLLRRDSDRFKDIEPFFRALRWVPTLAQKAHSHC
jgi:hypothetical protein